MSPARWLACRPQNMSGPTWKRSAIHLIVDSKRNYVDSLESFSTMSGHRVSQKTATLHAQKKLVSRNSEARLQRTIFMKAAVLRQPGAVTIENVPDIAQSNGSVLLRVEMVGLCGSDLNPFRGKNPMMRFPAILGHERSEERRV